MFLVCLLSVIFVLGCVVTVFLIKQASHRLDNPEQSLERSTGECQSTVLTLQERARLLGATLEYMDQGMSVADSDLNLVVFNKRFLELQAFPEELFYQGMPMDTFFAITQSRVNMDRGTLTSRFSSASSWRHSSHRIDFSGPRSMARCLR